MNKMNDKTSIPCERQSRRTNKRCSTSVTKIFAIISYITVSTFLCCLERIILNNNHRPNLLLVNAEGNDDYYYNVGQNDDLSNWDGSDDKFYKSQRTGDSIKYWTEYALQPKRCIEYNGVDVIVFSVFDNKVHQCSDTSLGTYYEPVQYFFKGYMEQKYDDAMDQSLDYEEPDVVQYAYCVGYYINDVMYYMQIGCADGTTSALAINIYYDKECTMKSTNVDGFDDATFDVSSVQLKFSKCYNCVNWFDMNQEVDDGFYEKRMTEAPMCSNAWESKQVCDRKCQRIGIEKKHSEPGWNTSDQLLLFILALFGVIMVGLIVRKRNKMSNKDSLLEQATLNAAGLQKSHIIGICMLTMMVVLVFVLLGLKNITWALMLLINTALFCYLMKLTIDSSSVDSNGETIIGPDGSKITRNDSDDDSSTEDNNNNNTSSSAATEGQYTSMNDDFNNNKPVGTSYSLPRLD